MDVRRGALLVGYGEGTVPTPTPRKFFEFLYPNGELSGILDSY